LSPEVIERRRAGDDDRPFEATFAVNVGILIFLRREHFKKRLA
jgi:hypothetical protein